ncbi:hexosyltransferase [Elysia marginata]|uniref:Hexosyltransferase n=1 Tax=Elysia marginata TaxID=1093978 RepID=A0AAV4EUL6_9GAST|nr:hexosyltransferase [Elysia marginata]
MVFYQSVKDLLGSNILGHRKPDSDIYPTEARTAFLLDLPAACVNVRDYDALVVVHSAAEHFRQRKDYRETYGNPEFTQPYTLKVIFFLGLPEKLTVQDEVIYEHAHHRDTVQSNFVDTYQNLSLKAVSMLRWLVERCPPPHLIIKMDDDVLLDVHKFFGEFIPLPPYHNDLVVHCHAYEGAPVEREGKWRLSRRQYAQDTFPDYCSGSLVLLTLAAAEELYYAALDTPILWVDDVYIYGLVRESTLDVQIMYLDHVSDTEDIYSNCVRLYGYRCKYWATALDRASHTNLVPALLSLQADRLRRLSEEYKTDVHPRRKDWFKEIAGPLRHFNRRRRRLERRRFGSTRRVAAYVEKYECTNKLVDPKLLRDSRLSFPSGHAAVSVYSALFTVFYLQLRLDLSCSYLLRPVAQLALVLLATFCCVSRISDHKHFVSDIAAGAAIGSSFAWLTFYKLGMRVIPEVPTANKPRVLPRAMSVESEPQTPTPLLRPAAYVQARRPDFADKCSLTVFTRGATAVSNSVARQCLQEGPLLFLTV